MLINFILFLEITKFKYHYVGTFNFVRLQFVSAATFIYRYGLTGCVTAAFQTTCFSLTVVLEAD